MRVLVDEDLPVAVAVALREMGHDAQHVREVGLRGQADQSIFAAAQEMDAILLTADLGFGDTRRYPLASHNGIVVLRLPDHYRGGDIVQLVRRFVESADLKALTGVLVVVDPSKFRIRRRE